MGWGCEVHGVQHTQLEFRAPFSPEFSADLNQGCYLKHRCERQILSSSFYLDQLREQRKTRRESVAAAFWVLTAGVSRASWWKVQGGQAGGWRLLRLHCLWPMSFLQQWPRVQHQPCARGDGRREAVGEGLQLQPLRSCSSSSKFKIWTVVLVLNICGISANHYKVNSS